MAEPQGFRALDICPDQVHVLTRGEDYISGYSAIGARPGWLNKKHNVDTVKAFLRAMYKGYDYAKAHPQEVVNYFVETYGSDPDEVRFVMEVAHYLPGFDRKTIQHF